MLPSLSILLSAPDADQMPAVVAGCLAMAAQHAADYELILLLHGRDEAAAATAARLAATHAPVLALHYQRHQGFRHRLRDAWSLARGSYILALDPLQVPLTTLPRLLTLAEGYAAVFGARRSHSAPTPASLAVRLATGSHLQDPGLQLLLARAELGELLPAHGPAAFALAQFETALRARGLAHTEVVIASHSAEPAAGRRAAAGLGLFVVACCLWLLRRLRRTGGP